MTVDNKVKFDLAIARRLFEFRSKHIHTSQSKAAKALKMHQSMLSNMEAGKAKVTVEFVRQLEDEYGLNGEWLTKNIGTPKSKSNNKSSLEKSIEINERIDKLEMEVLILNKTITHLINKMERMENKMEGLLKNSR